MSRVHFIDIKEKELCRYSFEAKGENYDLSERKAFPFSDTGELPASERLEKDETVYLSLPLSSLNFRLIDLPFSDMERIREVLPFELDGMVLGGAEAVIFDAVIAGRTDGICQVLAVYIEKSRLGKVLERLKMRGIDPVCVTSVELRHAMNGFSLSKLVPPVLITDEDRIALAIEEIRRPTVNLRRNEFSYTRGVEKTRRSLKVTAVLVAMILFVLAADIAFRILSSSNEIAFLKNEIRKSYLELFPGEKNIMNEIHQMKSNIRQLRDREAAIVGIQPLNVFLELARIERGDATFHEVTIERAKLVLRGEALSFSAVQQLEEKLKKYFDDVSVSDSRASGQGKTLFTITAKEKRA